MVARAAARAAAEAEVSEVGAVALAADASEAAAPMAAASAAASEAVASMAVVAGKKRAMRDAQRRQFGCCALHTMATPMDRDALDTMVEAQGLAALPTTAAQQRLCDQGAHLTIGAVRALARKVARKQARLEVTLEAAGVASHGLVDNDIARALGFGVTAAQLTAETADDAEAAGALGLTVPIHVADWLVERDIGSAAGTMSRQNAAVSATSMHATSVHLGLAADSVAQADYDMASARRA